MTPRDEPYHQRQACDVAACRLRRCCSSGSLRLARLRRVSHCTRHVVSPASAPASSVCQATMSNFLIVYADTSTARRIFLSLPYDSYHSSLFPARYDLLHSRSQCSNQPTHPSGPLSLRRLARHGALGPKLMPGAWLSKALRRRSLLAQAVQRRSRSTSTNSFRSRLRRRSSVFHSGESGRVRRGVNMFGRCEAKACLDSTSDTMFQPPSPRHLESALIAAEDSLAPESTSAQTDSSPPD